VDIFATGDTFLSQLLLQRLCEAFASPVLLKPLSSAKKGESANNNLGEPSLEKRSPGRPGGDIYWLPTSLEACAR
jgi:hypothetical protein